MYKELIKKYIGNLKLEHLRMYASSENIVLSDEELSIIYQFIQQNYESLLEDNTTILQLKNLLREDLYEQLLFLYQKNKTKYL